MLLSGMMILQGRLAPKAIDNRSLMVFMHPHHDIFVQAIKFRRKILLKYFSKKGTPLQARLCVPMDYSKSLGTDTYDCYHFWDFKYGMTRFPLILFSNQITAMEVVEQFFDPKEFVTWDTKKLGWFMKRDWGQVS